MDTENDKDKILLPHHEQQPLCTTRLPYRQGRKRTAVKVYTINDESRHLLVFGVPSLNLRHEAKSLFLKFGKIIQFNLSPEHEAEIFTETYHLIYEKIQSARNAKRLLDAMNYYGGSLHICYAPELETIQETRQKILQRKSAVLFRIQYLKKETLTKDLVENLTQNVGINDKLVEFGSYTETTAKPSYNLEVPKHLIEKPPQIIEKNSVNDISELPVTKRKLNMGEINTICVGKQIRDVFKPKKRKTKQKPAFSSNDDFRKLVEIGKDCSSLVEKSTLEVIDATSVNNDIITNINETPKGIVVKKIAQKPMNVIKFNIPHKIDNS